MNRNTKYKCAEDKVNRSLMEQPTPFKVNEKRQTKDQEILARLKQMREELDHLIKSVEGK